MPWRVTVEALPGAAPTDSTPIDVEAPSWVVALRTARELLGFPPPDPRELSVEVRDDLWRVVDRSLGRLFIVESTAAKAAPSPAAPRAPAAPADIVCELRADVAASPEQPFDYLEEVLVASRLSGLDVAHTWIKLRLAAWRTFRGPDAPVHPRWMLRLFAFSEAPASDDVEPVAYVEFRSWSGRIEILPPEESVVAAAIDAHHVPSAPVADPAPVPPHASAFVGVQTPVDVALVGAIVPPPRPSIASSVDLIGSIFDSVHDVHFAPTVVDGADLLCDIAFRNIPCAGAFIFFHDINNRGWIIASGSGDHASTVFGDRFAATDPLLSRIVQRRGALRVSGEACAHALNLGRTAKHALIAAASVGGRLYGAIELVDPPGGQPFTESQEHALAYLAEQFATFAASRGLVVREDDVRSRRT